MRLHALVSMRARENPSWQGVRGCPELAHSPAGEFKIQTREKPKMWEVNKHFEIHPQGPNNH